MTANSADYRRLLDLTGRGFVVLGAGLGIGAEFLPGSLPVWSGIGLRRYRRRTSQADR